MKFTCDCHDVRGWRNMSTPEEPGWYHKELKGRGTRPVELGGITFKCDACLSKDKRWPHRRSAIWSATSNTRHGVDCPYVSDHRERASAPDIIVESRGAQHGNRATWWCIHHIKILLAKNWMARTLLPLDIAEHATFESVNTTTRDGNRPSRDRSIQ